MFIQFNETCALNSNKVLYLKFNSKEMKITFYLLDDCFIGWEADNLAEYERMVQFVKTNLEIVEGK